MKKTSILISLFIISLSGSVGAIESINYTLRFGTDNISKDGLDTTGSGFSLQAEAFLEPNYGLIGTYGQSSTESDQNVLTGSGSIKPELSIENHYLQFGGFYYLFDGFRLATGLSLHRLDLESHSTALSEKRSDNSNGYFANIAYSYRFKKLLLGAEYSITNFAEYSQSGVALIIGLYF